MFRKILTITLIFVHYHQVNANNSQLPAILPISRLVSSHAYNSTAPLTKKGWRPVQQCEDIDRLWNSGVRMMKISVQWYQPDFIGNDEASIKASLISQAANDKTKPYLALCREKPATNNCPLTKLRRAGKDPQSLQQFFKKLATLLQNNPQEVFILKIVNHMYERSIKNGAVNFNETQIIQMLKTELESSGLNRLALPLVNYRQPLILGEIRNNKRLIIIDNHSALRLSQYVSSYKDYTDQIGKGNNLMEECLHINTHFKNKSKPAEFVHNHKSLIIDAVKRCYTKHNVTSAVVNTSFSSINDINKVINDLKNSNS